MMPRFSSYVATWSDAALHEADWLAGAAGDDSGGLLAFGPAHDSSEQDARAAPSHIAIAGFADEAGAVLANRRALDSSMPRHPPPIPGQRPNDQGTAALR
jgi:hypothetical protein